MNRIYFVADLFLADGHMGGAEKCDDCFLEEFLMPNYGDFRQSAVVKINSKFLTPEFVEETAEGDCYIIANFMTMRADTKAALVGKGVKYIIIEHDHKYLKTNNPALYRHNLANEDGVQNVEFYRKAYAVLCQSTLHASIVYRNTLLDNIVNLKGNLWSEEDLATLTHYESLRGGLSAVPNERAFPIKWGVLQSNNKNKGIPQTLEFIKNNQLTGAAFMPATNNFKKFVEESLSKVEGVLFFPTWIESFNRFVVEARALGCKVQTSDRVGAASDGYLALKGAPLIAKMRQVKKDIFGVYERLLADEPVETYDEVLPRVSIITTFVEAEEYVAEYIEHMVAQTIFDEIDLVMYDAGSTGREKEIIESYVDKYNNICYIRDESRIGSSEAFNKMITESSNDIIGMIMMDDRPAADYAEKLRKHLFYGAADLVYGDCVTTTTKNDTITRDFYTTDSVYEHSLKEFTPANMIKCLPGPMPMFKKDMVISAGMFDTTYQHANDWELWLRCVRNGSTFSKVRRRLGLYYVNPDGVTTSEETFESKISEENEIFKEYRDVIGEHNYSLYKNYFGQFENQ
jgi:glycosyltransferase involved in cell wall biosynthesis